MQIGKDYIGVGCWALVTNDKNQILFIKKKNRDFWERPGGKVELGELLEDAMVRETKEETNLITKPTGLSWYDQIFYGKDKEHWIGFCYHLSHESGEIKNLEPDKIEAVKWFDFSDLPKVSEHTEKAIKKYKNSARL